MDIWTVVTSGLVASVVAGWFTLRSKHNEYANTYYKMILERRLAAYEEVEQLIADIKATCADNDQLYHLMFSKDDDHANIYGRLYRTTSKALWLTDDLFLLILEFNKLVFTGTAQGIGLIAFGKKHYKTIGEIRTKLEKLHTRDMLKLYDIPAFLKHKKKTANKLE